MPSWIKADEKEYSLIDTHSADYGKYTICIQQYQSNIKCMTNVNATIKYKSSTKLQVIGRAEAVLIDRSCHFDFYNCCFQYSKSFARLSYDLFHPNGTLRAYKWKKFSNEKRYQVNTGCVLYFRKVFVEKEHRKNDLGFLACKQILRKIRNKFSIGIVKPEYKNSSHRYQRNLIRQIFWRLGCKPLEDGGNFPFRDYWYLLPNDMKSRKKDDSCNWNIPVLMETDELLHNMMISAQNYKDDSAMLKYIESFLGNPKRNTSMNDVLHHAAKHNMDRIVTCLLSSQQVDINCRDEYGNTVLHICSLSMYRQLLKYPNIDVHVENKAGKLPYDIAVESFSVLRCHDHMNLLQTNSSTYEHFYLVLHQLMPTSIYSCFMEGLLSPIMADTIRFSAGFSQAAGMSDFLYKSSLKPSLKIRICDIDEPFAELFPDSIRYKEVCLVFLMGAEQLLNNIEKCLQQDKCLPTKSRILKLCKSEKKCSFYKDFFKEGGTFEDILRVVVNYAYMDSFYYQKEKLDLICTAEQKVWGNLNKIPYFDEDLAYVYCFIINFLCRN